MENLLWIGLLVLPFIVLFLWIFRRDAIKNMWYLVFYGESYEDVMAERRMYDRKQKIEDEIAKVAEDYYKGDKTNLLSYGAHAYTGCKECDTCCAGSCTSMEASSHASAYKEPGVRVNIPEVWND